jgi:HEAT repeat protein
MGPAAKAAVPALVALLKENNKGTRHTAARALAAIGPRAVDVLPLTKALKDDDEEVRREAARALGAIGPEASASVPPLMEALKDPRIRSSVAQALGEIGPESKEAVPALVGILRTRRTVTAGGPPRPWGGLARRPGQPFLP